ncbi:MAG: GNAT family N-acetyltransferase [Actinomycetia bacterium]|nr:GNAT family N-acetyltransferase [Actinomycetes bacterium]
MSYLIRNFEPGMLDEVAELRRAVFGGTSAFNRAYLAWKYLENPYFPEALLHVALRDGSLVGMRGWYGTRWRVPHNDSTELIPCAAESAILPDQRDQGLYEELTGFALDDLARRGFPLVINMSATPANYVSSIMTMGWRRVGHYAPIVRNPLDSNDLDWAEATSEPTPTTRSRDGIGRLKGATRHFVDRLSPFLVTDPFRHLEESVRIASGDIRLGTQPDAGVMAEIAAASDAGSRIRHVRDEEYIRWRYRDPRSSYCFLYSAANAQPAFCVASASHSGRISFVDWAGSSPGVATLIKAAIAVPPTPAVRTWRIGMPQDLSRRLTDIGFDTDPTERRRGLLARPTSDSDAELSLGGVSLLDIDSWDLRMIFSDRH